MQRHKVTRAHVSQFNLILLIVFGNPMVDLVEILTLFRGGYYARGCPFSPITLLPLLVPPRCSVMVTNAGYFARLEAVDPAKLKMITGVRSAAYESWLLALREASTSRRTSEAFGVSSLK